MSFLYFDTLLMCMPTGSMPPTGMYIRETWEQVSG
ncbi:hypothetical protein LCGC14_2576370, partial [marine sediment metagenome]